MSYKLTPEIVKNLRNTCFENKSDDFFTIMNGYTVYQPLQTYYKEIEDLEIYDDDVWVSSFPRSGTTWTQEMVWCMCNNLDFVLAKVEIDTRFPFVEKIFVQSSVDMDKVKDYFKVLQNLPRPRYLKTHLPWELLPKQIRNFEKRPKIIFVSRDPKSVCVSFYHHSRNMHGYSGDLDTFSKLFLNDKILWTPYKKHLRSYQKHQNESNILCLKYEDMKNNLIKNIEDVSAFLNVNLDDNQIELLSKHISFDSMKNNKSLNRENMNIYAEFIRKGKIDSYKLEMNEAVLNQFEEWVKIN